MYIIIYISGPKNCILLLYTIHLSLSRDLVDPPPLIRLYETHVMIFFEYRGFHEKGTLS